MSNEFVSIYFSSENNVFSLSLVSVLFPYHGYILSYFQWLEHSKNQTFSGKKQSFFLFPKTFSENV